MAEGRKTGFFWAEVSDLVMGACGGICAQMHLDAPLNERSELRTLLKFRDNFSVKLAEELETRNQIRSVGDRAFVFKNVNSSS